MGPSLPRYPFLTFLLSLVCAASFAFPDQVNSGTNRALPPSRTFAFDYRVHVPPANDSRAEFLLWVPLPQQDEYQTIRGLHIDSAVANSEGREPQYGNFYVLFRPTADQLKTGFDASIHFVATRFEHKVPLESISAEPAALNASIPPDLRRDLEPDKLVPLNGVIAELAKQQTAGDTTTLEKARHIYNYVLATMRYDKSGEGWGRGDAIWACSAKHGNCTDFHALFIGMMRASGIPARFEIGFPIPASAATGEIPGYHCWAEFYLAGRGWVPVDASEAWKNPAKHDYFFGAHDVNRVFFTYGRDIRLSPEQHGDPLNYFIYPYAERNGKPFTALETKFSFRDISPGAPPVAK